MKLLCRIAGSLLFSLFIPVLAWAAIPFTRITDEVHDALRGCRWRRCVTVVPAMPRAEEDDRVRLRLNFDKGPPYYVEMTAETKQIVKVMRYELTQTQSQTFLLQCTPEGKNKSGHSTVRTGILGIKMLIDVGGTKIYVYTYDGNRAASDPLTPLLNALVGAQLVLTVGAGECKVKNIEGHEALLRKVGTTSPQMEPLLKTVLGKESLMQLFRPLFDFVPTHPVRVGDSWIREHALDLGSDGSYRNELKYTYAGKSGLLDRIAVQSNLKFEPPKNGSGLTFQIKSADLKATNGKGEILFDAGKGRLVESTLRQTLAGTMTIEVGDIETHVELEQEQTSRIRVTNTNPLSGRN